MDRPALRLPAKLDPSKVVAVRDTREQVGLDLGPLSVVDGTLPTGDYSIRGMEHEVAIELKGDLSDLLAVVGRERDRFEREVQRLLSYPVRAMVVCTTWPQIEMGGWRGRLTSRQVEGAMVGWVARGLPVCLVGDRERAGRMVSRLIYTAARRRYEQLRTLHRHWQDTHTRDVAVPEVTSKAAGVRAARCANSLNAVTDSRSPNHENYNPALDWQHHVQSRATRTKTTARDCREEH